MLNLELKQIIIQIIAFLIMLWVMKKYAWRPLLDTMEARRKKIKDEFDSIAAQKEEVKKQSLHYEEQIRKIDADTRRKIQEAIAEAHKISVEIQDDAKVQAKEILLRAQSEIKDEVVKAKNQLKNDMVNLIVHVTEKMLQEKLDPASQRKLIASFVEEAQLK
jgi:F-type H+-transporting ATPase subunit b